MKTQSIEGNYVGMLHIVFYLPLHLYSKCLCYIYLYGSSYTKPEDIEQITGE